MTEREARRRASALKAMEMELSARGIADTAMIESEDGDVVWLRHASGLTLGYKMDRGD